MVWDMFLREVKRQNKNGTQVSYLQLVHNEWDPTAQASRTKIVHSFGRTDQVDPAAIERLITSLRRLLDPTAVHASNRRNATIAQCRPLPHAWLTTPSAGSLGWPNSPTSHSRASTKFEGEARTDR